MKSVNLGAKVGILVRAAYWGALYAEEQAENLSAKRNKRQEQMCSKKKRQKSR